MPKTDINSILKVSALTKIKIIDYSTPEMQKHLEDLKKKCDAVLKNKDVNWDRLSRIYIKI